ncbi:tRNA (guanosine(37)-N1)-methyltransferase TrmD [Dokdonella sp. MW10]|uniref:tRNA (guanosine(37)-N1)-methyltransferase TrmD n=1 Tax=Dokdonella sp. MW10 TaxID=2992926 RepID=UPI003F8116B9
MRIDVITLFPDFIEGCAGIGVVGRARERGLLQVRTWNPRDFATDVHRTVDSRPFGGGPGMLMAIEPLRSTLHAVRDDAGPARVVYLSPQGARLTQDKVVQYARTDRLILLCGRYEGVDERLLANMVDEELSVGDYVLSGGELAAAIVIDAVGRLQDGALNDAQSAEQDSFTDGLLDCPHYTRPVADAFGEVPAVLLSGDHKAIRRWRRKQALGRTWLRRPDLLARVELDAESRTLLEEFRREHRAEMT